MRQEGVTFVRKFSKDAAYNERLLLQAKKQRDFDKFNKLSNFSAPRVLDQSSVDKAETWFDMKYVHAQKYSEFLERASVHEIRQLSKEFIAYFNQQFADAREQQVDQKIFKSKAQSVQDLLSSREDIDSGLCDAAFLFLSNVPGKVLPLAQCHGDFTFSNMLFDKNQIYLVDFLDSFVESPLIDFVKFRQDTFFHWSLLIDHEIEYSRIAKIVQVFRFLDHEIVNAFKGNTFVKQWYNYLQVFNLVRILPYVHQPSEIQFIQRSINTILIPQK